MASLHTSPKIKFRRFRLLAVLLGLFLGLLLAFALLRYYNNQGAPHFFGNYTLDGFEHHAYLGYAPKPSTTLHSCKVINNDTVYCVQYTLDAEGRRISPYNAGATKHVLFFGCSFTYGEGVDNEQTFAYQLGENRPDLQVYNYAYSGYGPQQTLAKLQFDDLSEKVEPAEGYLVYMLLPEHVFRASGEPYYVQDWGSSSPHYAMEGDSLKFYANHTAWRPFYTSWHRFLGWSGLARLFTKLPTGYTQADIDLTVAMLAKAKEHYFAQFPKGHFVVALFPIPDTEAAFARFISALEQADIAVWDLHKTYVATPEYIIANDAHPSAKGHSELAVELSRIID